MKKYFYIVIVLLLGLGLAAKQHLPDIALKDLNNKRQKISQYYKDGPVLMNFWNLACEPCKKEMKELDKLNIKYVICRNNFDFEGNGNDLTHIFYGGHNEEVIMENNSGCYSVQGWGLWCSVENLALTNPDIVVDETNNFVNIQLCAPPFFWSSNTLPGDCI